MSSNAVDGANSIPVGFEGNLTESQSVALVELRQRVQKSEYAADFARDPDGDRLLLRFLRATMKDKSGERKFQVDAAEARLLSTFKWRRDNGFEELRTIVESNGPKPDKYELFSKYYPSIDVVNEESGQLVRFLRFGRFISTIDPSVFTTEEWTRFFAYECTDLQHKLRLLSKKHGREISTYAVISDIHGMSFLSVANRLSFIKSMASVASDHFPEMLGKTFLIRCPSIFPAAFSLAKPFIDKDIVSKFVVSSDIPIGAMTELIPISSIPKEFGGTSDVFYPLVLADALKQTKN